MYDSKKRQTPLLFSCPQEEADSRSDKRFVKTGGKSRKRAVILMSKQFSASVGLEEPLNVGLKESKNTINKTWAQWYHSTRHRQDDPGTCPSGTCVRRRGAQGHRLT